MRLKTLVIFICFIGTSKIKALVPLESLILGQEFNTQSAKESDPLDYLFGNKKLGDESEVYAQFVGFYQEGENLKKSCSQKSRPRYSSDWNRRQVLRSIASTLQYIGLDLSLKSIASYARELNYSKTEFNNLGQNLINNYCSQNLSIISIRELKNNFNYHFEKGDFNLPSISGNTLFSKELDLLISPIELKEKELKQSVKLFRSFCSWNGLVDSFRLMTPFFKDPHLMAFLIRQLTKQKIAKSISSDRIYVKYAPETIQVSCENFICRKSDEVTFNLNVPRSIGSIGHQEDFEGLYCHYFSAINLFPRERDPRIKKWINDETIDDHQFLKGHLTALLTGMPNFFLRMDKFTDIKKIAKAAIDKTWSDWSDKSLKNFSKDLLYEEPLKVTLVERNLFYNPSIANFKIVFDVNLGEFDAMTESKGKLSSNFNLYFDKNFLSYIKSEWVRDTRDLRKKREKLKDVFRQHVDVQLKNAKDFFVLSPWSKGLEELIVSELIGQLVSFRGDYFQEKEHKKVRIPISFNYGLFALQYINYKFKTERELDPQVTLKKL